MSPNDIVEVTEFGHAGFPCVVTGKSGGYRCGYVELPDSHPWWNCGDLEEIDAKVHGGVTWLGLIEINGTVRTVVGFDCNHAWDANDPDLQVGPAPAAHFPVPEATVKTLEFAVAETRRLAEQAKAAEDTDPPTLPSDLLVALADDIIARALRLAETDRNTMVTQVLREWEEIRADRDRT